MKGLVQGVLFPQLGNHHGVHGFTRGSQPSDVTGEEVSGRQGDNIEYRQGDQNHGKTHNQQFSGYKLNHITISDLIIS